MGYCSVLILAEEGVGLGWLLLHVLTERVYVLMKLKSLRDEAYRHTTPSVGNSG